MGVVVIGAAVGNYIQKNRISLKINQIKVLFAQHQDSINKFKQLKQRLKKFNIQELLKKAKQMQKDIQSSIRLIVQEQKSKLILLKQIKIIQSQEIHLIPNLQQIDTLNDLLLTLFDVALIGVLFVGGDIVEGIITSIFQFFNMITNIMNIIQDEKKIQQLSKQQQRLRIYFQPGGKYEEALKNIIKVSQSMVKNQLLLGIIVNSIMKQYRAISQISILSEENYQLYNNISNIIQKQPFKQQYLKQLAIKNKMILNVCNNNEFNLQLKVIKIGSLLQNMELNDKLFQKNQQLTKILDQILQNKQFWINFQNIYKDALTTQKVANNFITIFKERQQFSEKQKQQKDPLFLKIIKDQLFLQKIAQNKINTQTSIIISYFTDKFYYENSQNRQILFGKNLKILSQRSKNLLFINTALYQPNGFSYKLIKPQSQKFLNQWHRRQNILLNLFIQQQKMKNPNVKIQNCYVDFMYQHIDIQKDNDLNQKYLQLYLGALISYFIQNEENINKQQVSIKMDKIQTDKIQTVSLSIPKQFLQNHVKLEEKEMIKEKQMNIKGYILSLNDIKSQLKCQNQIKTYKYFFSTQDIQLFYNLSKIYTNLFETQKIVGIDVKNINEKIYFKIQYSFISIKLLNKMKFIKLNIVQNIQTYDQTNKEIIYQTILHYQKKKYLIQYVIME